MTQLYLYWLPATNVILKHYYRIHENEGRMRRKKSESTTEPWGLKSETELSGSSLCLVIGSSWELAIGIRPEKLGNEEKGNTHQIEALRIHIFLLKKILLRVLIFQSLTLIHMWKTYTWGWKTVQKMNRLYVWKW